MKTLLLTLIISVNLSAQINFNTQFPKIGYGDHFWTSQSPLYYGNQPNSQVYSNYLASNFYYPQLQDLGLTHIVTFGGSYMSYPDIPLEPAYNPTLKVLDIYFTMRLSRYNGGSPFWGGVNADGQGNMLNWYPYEVGGAIASLSLADRNGFGTANKTSIWVQAPLGIYQQSWPDGSKTVFLASVGAAPGNLLVADLPYYHQARYPQVSPDVDSVKYRLVLNVRIDGYTNPSDNDTVALVKIYEADLPLHQTRLQKSHAFFATENALAQPLTIDTTTYPLLVKDFQGNGYIDLVSPYFLKKDGDGKDLKIIVYWRNKKNLYIDHFVVYDNYYEKLFVTSDSTTTYLTLKTQLTNFFSSEVSKSLYEHFYNDEPWPNSYRSVKKLSSLANDTLPVPNKYVNGAAGDYYNYMLQYGNSQGRPPYNMTDKYPFWYDYDTASTWGTKSVQVALDALVSTNGLADSASGLLPAIKIAQNYTPDRTDDIPLVCSIQVHGEKKLLNGAVTDWRFRSPTPNEIKVQGFLSMCYGAKGLMYYSINTQTPPYTSTEYTATYGLFDEYHNAYTDYYNNFQPSGLVQNPANPQVSNARFNAVKSLNAAIDKISGTLLQLTWQNGYSISHGQPSGTFITSVTTADSAQRTFVELGTFKDTLGNNLFMLVNRRTLTAESRAITVNFNLGGVSWEITDVGSGNAWIVTPSGSMTDNLNPGEGRLYKVSPATYAATRTIALGTTLTVNAGATAKFAQNASLTINGKLIVNGTSGSKATFTQSGSSGWVGIALNHDSSTIQNCIISYASSPLTITNVNLATITSCTINNSAFSGTQAVSISNSTPTITGLEIDGLSGSSNGVRYTNGKGGTLNESIIQNCGAGNGIVIQGNPNPTISNCSVNNNYYYGIIFIGPTTGAPLISLNEFSSNGTHGSSRVYFNLYFSSYSWGTVQNNVITGSLIGVGSYGGSSPTAGDAQMGKNTITGNDYGLMCRGSGSSMGFGYYNVGKNQYSGTCNNINGSTYYDAYADGGANIVAEYNWWGQSPPNWSKIYYGPGSIIDSTHWLTSLGGCPGGGGGDMIVQGNGVVTTAVDSSESISQVYQRATNALFVKDYTTSSILSQFILRSNASILEKQRAMVRLLSVFLQSGDSTIIYDLKSYFIGTDSLSQTAEELLANAYAATGKTANAVSLANDLITKNPGTEIEKRALLLLASLRSYDKSAESISSSALAALKTKFGASLDLGLIAALTIASDVAATSASSNKESVQKVKAKVILDSVSTGVKEYSIENYPNPFNPTTTIAYQLPKDGRVTIKIFDAIGREVTTLVDEFKPSGRYSVQFDASRLSSGIYFYSLRSGSFSIVKKMSLIK